MAIVKRVRAYGLSIATLVNPSAGRAAKKRRENLRRGLAVALAAAILASGGGVTAATAAATPSYATASQSIDPFAVKVSAPRGLTTSSTYDSLTVAWRKPAGTIGTLASYTVTVKQGSRTLLTNTMADTSIVFLNDLPAPGSAYTVLVTAEAESIEGYKKMTSPTVSVSGYMPKSPVVSLDRPKVTVSGVGSDRVTATWKKPAIQSGSITGYTVTVVEDHKAPRTLKLGASATTATMTGLNETAQHGISVAVHAVAPDGHNTIVLGSSYKYFTTKLSAASVVKVGKPTSITLSKLKRQNNTDDGNKATIAWKKPSVTGKIAFYEVTIKIGNKMMRDRIEVKGTKITVPNFAENATHTVYVTAYATSANGKYRATATGSKSFKTGTIRHLT